MTFTVPGPPVGYYAIGRTPNRDRMNAYHDYCRTVQRAAIAAGLRLPLEASAERPLLIDTVAYFATGRHPDPENVRKGVTDALFYAGKGAKKGSADKHTGGSFPPPRYDKASPRVEVTVRVAEVLP